MVQHWYTCLPCPHADMDRFVVPKAVVEASEVQRRLQQAAQQYHASQCKGKTRESYKKKEWADWSVEKRVACAQEYARNGISGVRLQYGKTHPPATTISHWAKAVANNQCLQKRGRPSALTAEESKAVKEAFHAVRTVGAPLDRELLVILANEAHQEITATIQSPPGNISNHPEPTRK